MPNNTQLQRCQMCKITSRLLDRNQCETRPVGIFNLRGAYFYNPTIQSGATGIFILRLILCLRVRGLLITSINLGQILTWRQS